MENSAAKTTKIDSKSVVYNSSNDASVSSPPEEDFSVKKVNKKFLILLIGFIVIPFVVYFFSSVILPLFRSPIFAGVTIKYWGIWEDKAVFEKLIFEFERLHPNIKIEYEKQDVKTLGKYIDRLSTRINNGTGPDIYRFHNTWTYQLKNFLRPLPADLIASSEIDKKYFQVVKSDMNIGGAYYGIPLGIDTLSLFINEKMFKDASLSYPATWYDLEKAAGTLMKYQDDRKTKIQVAGIAMGLYDNVDHATDILSLLMVTNNVNLKHIYDPTMKQSATDALRYYVSFAKADTKRWDDTFENSKLAFAKGKVAMFFGYSWDIFDIEKVNPKLEYKVLPVPHIPEKNVTIASYWAEGVSAKTKHEKEAFEFLKFLTTRENLEKFYTDASKLRKFGEPYPRRDMADMLAENKNIYPFVMQADYAVSTPFSSNTYDFAFNSALNEYMGNAIRSAYSDSAYDSSIDKLGKGASEIFGRYGIR